MKLSRLSKVKVTQEMYALKSYIYLNTIDLVLDPWSEHTKSDFIPCIHGLEFGSKFLLDLYGPTLLH